MHSINSAVAGSGCVLAWRPAFAASNGFMPMHGTTTHAVIGGMATRLDTGNFIPLW
jgi:hypothetical protein